MGARHVLGDQATDAAQRLAPAFFGAAAVPGGRAHVVLGDAALRSRSFDGGQIDAELLRDSANERRRPN